MNWIMTILSRHYFNPRPPWGGRPLLYLVIPRTLSFQSTPSVGRATYLHEQGSAIEDPFQSTPSVGRATFSRLGRQHHKHQFQSTPSVGRATSLEGKAIADKSDFNPRPPWGGRPALAGVKCCKFIFQSTPSVGRATIVALLSRQHRCRISIHALRGEGDQNENQTMCRDEYFNPRPPWGGRRTARCLTQAYISFQSTPSVGRATYFFVLDDYAKIHFNPRPPWGGRLPRTNHFCRNTSYFNPRPPWGGRP